MNNPGKGHGQARHPLANPVLWAVYILYILVQGYAMAHHELWGDEIHSWNIAKGSAGFFELISNTRYEGHPPVWYIVLWSISKFTHNLAYVQLVQSIIADGVVFILLFFSPFPLITRILIPFGYYFMFEYAVLSRNYAIGLLLAFSICSILRKDFKHKILVYYGLLFLLSNVHLLAAILGCSLHVYFLLLNMERKKKTSFLVLHILLGVLLFLPCLYFVTPPPDSLTNAGFWFKRWGIQQFAMIVQAPLRAFIPIPAWWNYHFWNTQFLLEAHSRYHLLKFIDPFVSLALAGLMAYLLKANKKCLIFFATNLLLTGIIGIVFPLSTARYAGFLFISFIAAYWLFCYETPTGRRNGWIIHILLIVQIIGGIFAVVEDIRFPFSLAYKANEVYQEVDPHERTVTDYWSINAISAFIDKPFYCIDIQKTKSFLFWDHDIIKAETDPHAYTDGVKALFKKEGITRVFLISINPPQKISLLDPQLFKSFQVKLIDSREGAIENGGNLYLYRISSL